MENNQRNSRKRLNSLILLVAFTAVMLIVSTYAWFSTQKNVTLSSLYGAVNVAEGLQMSLDASVWVNEIDFSDFDQTNAKWPVKTAVGAAKYFNTTTTNPSFAEPAGEGVTTITNVIPEEYLPVSTTGLKTPNDGIGQSKLNMYAGNVVGNNPDLQTVKLMDEKSDSGYFAFDLFLMNTSATGVTFDKLQLDANSSVTADNSGTGIENSVRVGFALYENINNDTTNFKDYRGPDGTAGTADDDTSKNDMTIAGKNTLSAADIIKGTSTGKNIKDIAIWEPNANAHTDTIVNTNNKLKLTSTDITNFEIASGTNTFAATDKLPTYGLTSASVTKCNADTATPKAIYKIYDWSADGIAATGLQMQHTTQTTSSGWTTSTDLISVGKKEGTVTPVSGDTSSAITIAPNQYQKIRVYVWIDGQDPDCINAASLGGGLTLDIGFSKPGSDAS